MIRLPGGSNTVAEDCPSPCHSSQQMRLGDLLCVDWDAGEERLVFQREGEGAVVPVVEPQRKVAAQAVRASGGRAVEVPSTAFAREVKSPLHR